MKKTPLLCLLGLPALAQNPELPRGRGVLPPQVTKPLVEGLALSLDDPAVAGALACVTRNLPLIKVQSVTSATQRAVSGVSITLRCRVLGEDGPERWEFVVSRKAGKEWALRSARFLGA